MSKVINTGDGKGPRVWCRRCGAWKPAHQRPWPKSGYVVVHHEHRSSAVAENPARDQT